MSFLSPWILWGLLAAALPVIIHLLNRRRFRTVKWAATDFLLKASRESKGKKKLKHLLILACRTLAIVALIFAVARPLVGGFLGSGGGSVDTVILILDRSASMETSPASGLPSQREQILAQISETIETMGSPRLLLLDSATEEIQDVPSPELLPQLSATYATDTEADIPSLLTKAIDYLTETRPGKSEIWLASDLERNDWRPEDSRWAFVRSQLESLPTSASLRILTAEDSELENFSLELLRSQRVGDELVLDLRLTRDLAQNDAVANVTYSLAGARSSEQVSLTGQELRFQKRIPLRPTELEGYGWVGLNSDANPRDNVVYFAFAEEAPAQTYIVAENPRSALASYLEKAAAPPGLDRFEAYLTTPQQTVVIDWDSASLIIWQAPLPTGVVVDELTRFLQSGGTVLFLPPTEPEGSNVFLGTSWGPLETAPRDEFFINGSWLKDDGPWRNGSGDSVLPIDRLRALQRRQIEGELTALAEWDDNTPLLSRQIEGLGTAVFLGTLPDDRWSNLEHTALHLVTIQRLIQEGLTRFSAQLQAVAGGKKAALQSDEDRERLDSFEDDEPALGQLRAGVYRLGQRTLAVNRPSSEKAGLRMEQASLERLLEDTPYTLFANTTSDPDLVSEAWRAFLVAVLLFLLAEALLCLQPRRNEVGLKTGQKATSAS